MSYKCQDCKYNRHGWCDIKKINGLKKRNIQDCDEYKTSRTQLKMARIGQDYLKQDQISISINDNIVELPIDIIKKFINDDNSKNIEITFPD